MSANNISEKEEKLGLITKRAELIVFQNQIAWIASEYDKAQRGKKRGLTDSELDLYVMLYEYLNTIIKQMIDCDLERHLSPAYKEKVNDLMRYLKSKIAQDRTRQLSATRTFNVINNDVNSNL